MITNMSHAFEGGIMIILSSSWHKYDIRYEYISHRLYYCTIMIVYSFHFITTNISCELPGQGEIMVSLNSVNAKVIS